MKFARQWPYTFIVGVSLLIGMVAAVGSVALEVPLRDPEGFLGPAYIRLPLLALLMFALGILPAAVRRCGWKQIPQGVVEVVRHEWNLRRVLYIATGLATFYVCYVGYRNLKSVLPVYREGTLYDHELLELDRWMFGGTDPAIILHNIFGMDLTAEVLSFIYVAYLPLIPITLGVFLVLSRDLTVGAWYATTLSLNWVLGTISYYIMPALGPIYARPDLYAQLPNTSVSSLQSALMNNRLEFLADPATSDVIHGVAAFASLHVSVTFAAALFMHRTNQHRLVRWVAWAFFGMTFVATLYFGWHYMIDNIAGVAIGWAAVSLGAWATNHQGARRLVAREQGMREEEVGIDIEADDLVSAPALASESSARNA